MCVEWTTLTFHTFCMCVFKCRVYIVEWFRPHTLLLLLLRMLHFLCVLKYGVNSFVHCVFSNVEWIRPHSLFTPFVVVPQHKLWSSTVSPHLFGQKSPALPAPPLSQFIFQPNAAQMKSSNCCFAFNHGLGQSQYGVSEKCPISYKNVCTTTNDRG